MATEKEKIWNVPNALSFYRLAIFPYILYLAFTGNEDLFAVFLCISLVTDILDGFIARYFKLQTKFGAQLDSLADIGVYVLAVYGIIKFKSDEIGSSMIYFWIFLAILILEILVALIKFRRNSSLHLYSAKITGYLQGIFFFLLFAWGFQYELFIIAMVFGTMARTEEIIILLKIKEMRSDAKGLYWILKEEKSQNLKP